MGGAIDKQRDAGQRLHGVADVGHVDVDAAERRTRDADRIGIPCYFAAHLFKAIHETNIALKRIPAQAFNRRRAAADCCCREEVTGRRSVWFDIVVASRIALVASNCEMCQSVVEFDGYSERLHHGDGHVNVRL